MNTKAKTEPKEIGTDREATVSVCIPSEGTGAFLEGALNGVSFRIPTGTVVEVPKRIARVIAESIRQIPDGRGAVEPYTGVGGRKIG